MRTGGTRLQKTMLGTVDSSCRGPPKKRRFGTLKWARLQALPKQKGPRRLTFSGQTSPGFPILAQSKKGNLSKRCPRPRILLTHSCESRFNLLRRPNNCCGACVVFGQDCRPYLSRFIPLPSNPNLLKGTPRKHLAPRNRGLGFGWLRTTTRQKLPSTWMPQLVWVVCESRRATAFPQSDIAL